MNKSLIAGTRILVVEDDVLLQQLLRRIFENAGAVVSVAADGESGLLKFHVEQPDLVVLNVRLPRLDGWRLCRRIKREANVPVLFVSATNANAEMLAEESCDDADFLQKPFSPEKLLAWAGKALYRETAVYKDNHLRIDLAVQEVSVQGRPVHLTHTEFRLLEFLVQHADILLSYEQLLRQVWGWDYDGDPAVVHVYVSRLRKKIEPDPKNPRYLLLTYGIGYQFCWSDEAGHLG